MINRRLLYYILAAFIAGNLVLVFLQYNSSQSIKRLITGNENLLNEFKLSNELKELEKDVVLVENKVHEAIATRDTTHLNGLELQIAAINANLDQLQKINDDDSTIKYVDVLDGLIREKLSFSNEILDSFYHSGKPAADLLTASPKGRQLTDSILLATQKIDDVRRGLLTNISESIDENSRKASQWSVSLIALVIASGIGLFLFIINRMTRQQLLMRQLDASEKNVREAARIKENFLANMSHEIRTPLNAVLGYTDLLQRKEMDSEAKQYVSTIHKSGENLLAIVNDILDLSKIEAGMMRIEEAPFSVRGLVHSIETLFANKIHDTNLSLTTNVEDSIPDTLLGDAVRLTQVLVNLVSNAIKFTPKGMVVVEVFASKISQVSVQLGLRVIDTGIGIEENKLQTIFERFRQAEDATTRNFGGTGLGLSIVKDIVSLQNGTIHIESRRGTGTSVTVIIPYKIAKDQSPVVIDSKKPVQEVLTDGLDILVVEDNMINQQLMDHLLNEWKVNHIIAGNGKEALEILKEKTFDLVLMDIQMPEMDGYSTTRVIRNELQLNIPIIAMTAHAMEGEREKCFSYGMNDHIAKPIREKELYRVISRFVILKPLDEIHRSAAVEKQFFTIDLDYIHELAKGDKGYEKMLTNEFLEVLPQELSSLSKSFAEKNWGLLSRIAHSMKTSISVMGLNKLLDTHLDEIEYAATGADIEPDIDKVKEISFKAIEEAKSFLQTLGS